MDERSPSEPGAGLEADVARAKAGDRDALESVVRAVHKDVYRVALRFLWHPQDAEDVTQEILIRVITGLATFRGDSSFRTWAYRIACNTLLTMRRKGRMEQRAMSFEEFGQDLAQGLSNEPFAVEDVDQALLLEEVKIGCTMAMLLCLDRPHRVAYILGEIVELDHKEAAKVLDVSPPAFRKRLSRAREMINSFMMSRCGLVNPANSCRCRKRVATAVSLGRVDPAHLLFASSLEQARRFPAVLEEIRHLEETRRAAALYRSQPETQSSEALVSWLKGLVAEEPGLEVRPEGDQKTG